MKNWAWQDALVERADEKNIAVVAPCGTGKTRGAIKLSEAKEKPVLIICPANLISQWKAEIQTVHGSPTDSVFCVNSSKRKTKKYQAELKEFLEG